jgi:hypothetical protein
MVSWSSNNKRLVMFCSVEVGYMVAILLSCEAIWIHNILTGIFG